MRVVEIALKGLAPVAPLGNCQGQIEGNHKGTECKRDTSAAQEHFGLHCVLQPPRKLIVILYLNRVYPFFKDVTLNGLPESCCVTCP